MLGFGWGPSQPDFYTFKVSGTVLDRECWWGLLALATARGGAWPVERFAGGAAPPDASLQGQRELDGGRRVGTRRTDAARDAALELKAAHAAFGLQLAAVAVEPPEVRRPAAAAAPDA